MLLETKRLLIAQTTAAQYDEDIHCLLTNCGIYLKTQGLTMAKIMENKTLFASLRNPIGVIGVGTNGWIDYYIKEEHRNQGYAAESLEAVKKYAIDNNVEPFLAIDDDNEASIATAKKCDFVLVAKTNNQGRYYPGNGRRF